LRQGANDPQIQIAEDAAVSLKNTTQIPSFGPDKIDLSKTLSVFLAIYDKDGNPLDSNANVDGQLPKPPKGVFDEAQKNGQNRVTWQPTNNVRQALIVIPVGNEAGQFVVVGRSLREVEIRENQTFQMAAAVWGLMIIVSFIGLFVLERKKEVAPVVVAHHHTPIDPV
jgi:hypothetical protein